MMEKFVYYARLFDLYGGLLSDNERITFSSYYEENLSMQEIADNRKISKSAVGATIKNVELKLSTFESTLHLESKSQKLDKILLKIPDKSIKRELEKLKE